MKKLHLTQLNAASTVLPNRWDVVAFCLIYGVIALVIQGGRELDAPLATIQAAPLSLAPEHLPGYALQTVLRMMIAMAAALAFTFTYATLAAKNARAGAVMIPLLDILQSVPVLGFISFTVVFFMGLFPGSTLGVECAAIFAIFTSQAWNMTFSFYQSLRTVPRDLEEVSRAYRLSGWQRFWRLEVPFAMPGLVWNAMISMSGGWFFVVASEAITVGDTTVALPGIGSYVALAIAEKNLPAIGWAVAAMFLVILIYDQLLFRPLIAWSERFRGEESAHAGSWVLTLLQRTRLLQRLLLPLQWLGKQRMSIALPTATARRPKKIHPAVWSIGIAAVTAYGGFVLGQYMWQHLAWADVGHAILLGFYTLLRVMALIVLASLVWVPVGIWIGLRPRLAAAVQPLVQFLAAFPANLVFPLAVMAIMHTNANPNIWLSPLMILGTQWYILFNVIAGAAAFPQDLKETTANLHIYGKPWWMKVILPAIFPYYITGAINASGGSWNASIVAETVQWGSTTLTAQGIGAYIVQATTSGDYPRIVLGITVMSLYVLLLNRLFWRRLYRFAEQRLRFD